MHHVFKRLLAVLLLASMPAAIVHAANDLAVDLRPVKSALTASDDVEFVVEIRNNGSRPLRLLKWDLPGETDEGSFFNVSRDGNNVLYIGKHYKRGKPTAADFLLLKSGETLSRTIDLSTQFDFTATGTYQVQYAPHHELPTEQAALTTNKAEAASVAGIGTSPSVTVWVQAASESLIEKNVLEKNAQAPVATDLITIQSVSYAANCSTSRRSSIASAVSAANTMATNAKSYLQNRPTSTRATSTRYKTWFGTYVASRWTTATNHFVSIDDALDTKALVFDCGCTDSAYAYVYPTQPYKVYLCNAFWSAPMTGTDSKGGTIVHELSHFNVVAATDDRAYGQSAAKSLAISNPAGALDNADSHEYFAENTPALQ